MQASRGKASQKEKQKLEISLGYRPKIIMPWQSAHLDFAPGAPRNQCSASTPLPMKKDKSGRRLCEYWSTIFQARSEGERHHHKETILRYVQKAPDDICWEIYINEFDELMATKESAPDPDGIPYGLYRCAGGLGSSAHKHVLEGGAIPALFAESRNVFIPKSSDVDNNGRIVRSREALRPWTLCNCDCKILTTAICRGLHW